MNTALIFGANGQDGIYTLQYCLKNKIVPVSVARSEGVDIKGSVTDWELVRHLIQEHQPAYIFHLAANSTTRHEVLFENHETISTGTLYILEAVKKYSPKSKVLITGSGVQFKNNLTPISESDAFEASSAYSVARIQSVYAGRYFRSLGLQVYVAYLFHHESPFRKPHHISKMITNHIKNILKGSKEKITIGDATVEKEWAFAEDIVEGMFTLMNQDQVFEACIGTGKAYSIEQFLELCFQESQIEIKDHVVFLSDFKSEYPILVSDPKTINDLGWLPKTSFEELVRILLL